jgi:hypothetical protein
MAPFTMSHARNVVIVSGPSDDQVVVEGWRSAIDKADGQSIRRGS